MTSHSNQVLPVDSDAKSTTSEDSQEPYYHITTGKVVKAREAWAILAAENHPRYNNNNNNKPVIEVDTSVMIDSGFPSSDSAEVDNSHRDGDERDYLTTSETQQDLSPSSFDSNSHHRHHLHHHIRQDSSFSADPTQSSIDRALHNPESPTASISPYKDMKQVYKPASAIRTSSSSSTSPHKDIDGGSCHASTSNNNNPYSHNSAEVPCEDDEEEESDPIILRATAMAMAAQNGLKLTPEQLALIAQPDVQQQKLIEEAKRVQKAKEMTLLQQQQGALNLQSLGADIKKFIQSEKEKPPLQWGADFGKFIESQMMQHAHHQQHHGSGGGVGNASHSSTSTTDSVEKSQDVGQGGKNKDGCRPSPSPPKKKMEGFGCDPTPPDTHGTTSSSSSSSSLLGGKGLVWPSMTIPTPSLPSLNESIATKIMLPGAGGSSSSSGGGGGIGNRSESNSNSDMLNSSLIPTLKDGIDVNEPVVISTTLWKRRCGVKKNSIMVASSSSSSWERIRVELRGNKLFYYKSGAPLTSSSTSALDGKEKKIQDNGNSSGLATVTPSRSTSENNSSTTPTPNVDSTTKRLSVLFQAAEQKIQTAKEEFNRLASATGLERKMSSSSSSADSAPLGVMDLVKENASVSASMGHSSAPSPFCLSIKVKSETKWKFSFERHGEMMEWLSALTDIIVKASVDAFGSGREMEFYCIQRRDDTNQKDKIVEGSSSRSLHSFFANGALLGDRESKWIIWITLVLLNVVVILARTSDLQFWKLLILLNFGMWQLTRCSLRSAGGRKTMGNASLTLSPPDAGSERNWSYKPAVGSTTIKVAKEDDSNITEKGHQLPTWVPIPSSGLEVRSLDYLTTKKKISSPGELYECFAVDCFVSNARVPEIATRMKFDEQFEANSIGKTWRSPEIFVVSISIPTEPPKFGYSTDDGPGATIVGYFKMKEETRTILRRITADGYDPSTDTADSEIDVQKRLTNGVRLWERFCQEAPTDPTFQARFKLIPSANLEELGCPSYIAKYNGKPVLIKRKNITGFFNEYPALNVSEFDVSLHPFPYLFKQGMAYMKEYFDKSVWTLGFVIEGRNNDELPEVVIGAMKVCRPSPTFTVNGEELFSGTCSKVGS